MTAIMASLIENVVKFLLFIAVAWAGIVCGKKYKDHRASKSADSSAENKESK